jgi:hypothetical protein
MARQGHCWGGIDRFIHSPGREVRRYARVALRVRAAVPALSRRAEPAQQHATGLTDADLLAFRSNLSALRFKLALLKWRLKAGFDPNQPRVPAGNPDGGQWTDDGGTGARLAAADKPRIGAATIAAVAVRVAKRIIDAYRSENGLFDLFGHKDGTVAYATFDGKDIFGSNSTSPTYTSADDAAAGAMRDRLIEKYPDVMNADEVGRMPNVALYHAETTILLRAARENGGTLAGRTLEVFVDNPMCNSCDRILPLVGLELGDPTATFVGPKGVRKTMRNGSWVD